MFWGVAARSPSVPSAPRGRPFPRPPIWISVARGAPATQVVQRDTPSPFL
jgi:hypothetical protein